jgi:multiple antibiotic resistance protein
MHDFLNAFFLCYAALFPIVNPIGNMPLFISLTASNSEHERSALAGKVAVNGFLLLLGSLFIGSYVLEFFGISLPILRIGGGLVVTAFGWRLLNPDHDAHHRRQRMPPEEDAFYPFTMPLTVGPGSISVAIALGSQRPGSAGPADLVLLATAAVAGLLAIAVTVFLCYRFAESTMNRLGAGGMNVVIRLAAFILLCIGLQMIWHGWQGLTPPP